MEKSSPPRPTRVKCEQFLSYQTKVIFTLRLTIAHKLILRLTRMHQKARSKAHLGLAHTKAHHNAPGSPQGSHTLRLTIMHQACHWRGNCMLHSPVSVGLLKLAHQLLRRVLGGLHIEER